MYEDFAILITSTEAPAGGSNVSVRFGADTATGTFSLAAAADAVARINAAILQPRPEAARLQDAGGALFNTLFHDELRDAYLNAAARASERDNKLRLRFVANIPALMGAPWEYLYDRRAARWPAIHRNFSLVRSLPLTGKESLAVDETLRVLVMLAGPSDLRPLDSAGEWAQLARATATADIELIAVEPTYAALQDALRSQPHIFHFVGHGLFPDAGQDATAHGTRRYDAEDEQAAQQSLQGALALCDANGRSDLIEADRLATLLTAYDSLRLVLLNACQGAVTGTASAFAGVAQKLIQQGLPAVIAMQAPIYDDHALLFGREFYQALASGDSVEQAVQQGRISINEVSYAWGIPTLYFQGVEPFAIQPLSNVEKAARLWQKAERMKAAEPASHRRTLLEKIVELDPNHGEAANARKRLDDLQEAERLYAAALANIKEEHWSNAYRSLEQVEKLAPNYRDTRSLLAEIRPRANPSPAPVSNGSFDQYLPILNALKAGRLVPFLGWDAGRVGRPDASSWQPGHYMPDASEAAASLAASLGGDVGEVESLLQVSQYTTLLEGEPALFERLQAIYAAGYPPTTLHSLLAELPGRLRAKGYPSDLDRRYVIFSTAFDDLLERAFQAVGQPFHLFAYRPQEMDAIQGLLHERFIHIPPNGETVDGFIANSYTGHDQGGDRLPVIVKLCGQTVTADPKSVVVTEDQYLDYLPNTDIGSLLPMTLLKQINGCSFVFFGYTLRPWHFRLLWKRMRYQNRPFHGKAWAFLPAPSHIEQLFWRSMGLEPVVGAPEGVVAYVNQWLDALEPRL